MNLVVQYRAQGIVGRQQTQRSSAGVWRDQRGVHEHYCEWSEVKVAKGVFINPQVNLYEKKLIFTKFMKLLTSTSRII
jgi:hypothetical protein